jgi:hypothetical protein
LRAVAGLLLLLLLRNREEDGDASRELSVRRTHNFGGAMRARENNTRKQYAS